MPGVPKELAEHRIEVNEGSKPVKQWLRCFSLEKKVAIKKKNHKTDGSRVIREILHPD
jgi:hypothetical protein